MLNNLYYPVTALLVHGPPGPELPRGLPWKEEKVHLGGRPRPHSSTIPDFRHTKDLANLRIRGLDVIVIALVVGK